ncbi:hypothetical protein WN51_02584 [Melipona quadrifasciata]|uniref:Uncharacterized protein n=1 Tax=Melipona quadrifasciata TaxID=166423 RepID=A0A0N0U3W8_9HYME|nr:hypothetical protein WN51_02584 [Melipona quadrifasciata]
MMKKEKPMMSVTAIIQGTQAQHWSRGNTLFLTIEIDVTGNTLRHEFQSLMVSNNKRNRLLKWMVISILLVDGQLTPVSRLPLICMRNYPSFIVSQPCA